MLEEQITQEKIPKGDYEQEINKNIANPYKMTNGIKFSKIKYEQ